MEDEKIKMPTALTKALKKQKIENLSKVQKEVYGKILDNKDLIVQSETGSGKTLAYLLPLFVKYGDDLRTNKVIILVPTHELALQVQRQSDLLAANSEIPVNSAVVIGGVNINRQILKLKEKPQIIVGTPGRIYELIKKKKIAAHMVKTIILDEADKLLEKESADSVNSVIKCTMKDRQLLMFSASIPEKTAELASGIMKEPEFIKIQKRQTVPENIRHIFLITERREKIDTFRKAAGILKPEKALVFVNKTADNEQAAAKLTYHHMKADCIHGRNLKQDRKKAIEDFRKGKIQFLIATDLAARGLHFDNIDMVFHLSIPKEPRDYLHRAGRTGRNGKEGLNVLIVTKEELSLLQKYKKILGIKLQHMQMYKGNIQKGHEIL